MVSKNASSSSLKAAEDIGLPYIFFDRLLNTDDSNYVISNDYATSCVLTQKLIDSGCVNLICLTHLYASSFEERERGFVDTLRKNGFSAPEDRVYRIDTSQSIVGGEIAQEIARMITTEAIDGVLAVNAEILIATISSLNAEVETSDRPLFVNFDDVGMFRYSGLIASAVQDAFEYGKLAAELLMGLTGKWNTFYFKVEHPFKIKEY